MSWIILREYGREKVCPTQHKQGILFTGFLFFLPLIFTRCGDGRAAGLGHGAELSFRRLNSMRPTGSGRRVEVHRTLGCGLRGGVSPSPVQISLWRSGAGGGHDICPSRRCASCFSPF